MAEDQWLWKVQYRRREVSWCHVAAAMWRGTVDADHEMVMYIFWNGQCQDYAVGVAQATLLEMELSAEEHMDTQICHRAAHM